MEKLIEHLTDQKFLLDNFLWTTFFIGPVTSIIAAQFGRKAWIKYEIVTSIVLGLLLAFKPDLIFPIMMKSPLKPYHLFLTSAYACYLISIVLGPLFVLNSADESIFYGHYYARIVEHSLIAIENIVSYTEGLHWNYKYLCIVTSFALSHLIINIYFLWRTPKPSGQNPFKDLANSIGKIDFYILLVCGAYVYAFPDRVNLALGGSSTLNESYRSLTRSCGAFFIGTSLESFCMSEFKFIRDKKSFFLARLLASLIELSVFFSGFFCFQIYSIETFAYLAISTAAYKLFLLYGYLKTPQEHLKAH